MLQLTCARYACGAELLGAGLVARLAFPQHVLRGGVELRLCYSPEVTPFYFMPEGGVKPAAYDERVDLWSMGVIVYVLLSGCPPFAGRTDREILSRVARAPLQFPARLWRGASHEARLFVARLLERIDARTAGSDGLVSMGSFAAM